MSSGYLSMRLAGLATLAGTSCLPLAAQIVPPPPQARVFFASGQATLLRRPEAPRSAAADSTLQPGDVVATARGRVQFALADGARVALQPDSEAQLPAREAAASNLAEPDLRLVAGTVRVQLGGPVFRLETLRATVLVQGPAFTAAYNSDGSITIASERTPVEVCTAAGCATAADDNVRVRADNVVPTRTNARPLYR